MVLEDQGAAVRQEPRCAETSLRNFALFWGSGERMDSSWLLLPAAKHQPKVAAGPVRVISSLSILHLSKLTFAEVK